MPVIPLSLKTALRKIHKEILDSNCTIYSRGDTKDAMGSPLKVFTVERTGNVYPLPCQLQDIDRRAGRYDEGIQIRETGEYNLILPWNTLIEDSDQVVVHDETGRSIRVRVAHVYRRSARFSITAQCKTV